MSWITSDGLLAMIDIRVTGNIVINLARRS